MVEIYNSKRAGLYMNGVYAGYVTDITVRITKDIKEIELVGSDRKIFTDGVQNVTFSFSSLHVDNDGLAYLADQYSTYNTSDGTVDPSALDYMQSEYAIWQTTIGAGNTVNKLQDDSGGASNYQVAQAFISPGTSLKSGKVLLNKVGSPTPETLNWKIVNNNAGAPGATTYISGTIAGGSLPGTSTPAWVDLGTPTNTTPIVAGTQYWLVLYFGAVNNGTGDNYYGWGYDNANLYKPQLFPQTKSSEQVTDNTKTKFSLSTDGGTGWTPSGTYLDQTFLLTFDCTTNWNIAVRLVQRDGTTVGWFVLTGCRFNPETKDIPPNDVIKNNYSGVARTGKYQLAYLPLP